MTPSPPFCLVLLCATLIAAPCSGEEIPIYAAAERVQSKEFSVFEDMAHYRHFFAGWSKLDTGPDATYFGWTLLDRWNWFSIYQNHDVFLANRGDRLTGLGVIAVGTRVFIGPLFAGFDLGFGIGARLRSKPIRLSSQGLATVGGMVGLTLHQGPSADLDFQLRALHRLEPSGFDAYSDKRDEGELAHGAISIALALTFKQETRRTLKMNEQNP